MIRIIRTIITISFLVVSASSCAQGEQQDKKVILTESGADAVEQHYGNKDDIKTPVASSLTDIQKMLGLSCQSDNHCKVIGVGDRPCGGPDSYLVYSSTDTDEKLLKSQVAIFNGLQKLNNSKKGVVGICQHLSPPKTYCSNNQCVASLSGRATELK